MQTYGEKLTDEQEVLMHLADIAIDVFSAESAVLRAQRRVRSRRAQRAALHVDAARVFVNDAAMRIDAVGAPGAGGDGRGRHASHDARGAAASAEGDARSTPSRCGGGSPTRPSRAGRIRSRNGSGLCEAGLDGSGQTAGPASLVAGLLLALARDRAARANRRTTEGLRDKIAADRAAKDAAFAAGDDPIPKREARRVSAARVLPDRSRLQRAGVAQADRTIRRSSRCRRRPARIGKMRRVGTLEFTLKGQPMKLHGVRRARRPILDRLFVPFSDLTSGTETYAAGRYPGSRPQRDRHLRARFQPRLHSVLLLQPDLRVPAIRRVRIA